MRNLLKPRWIILFNTLPIALLFFLFINEFNIIKTLLNERSIGLWHSFGLALGSIAILNLIYGLYLIFAHKKVSVFYGILALLIYIPFIYFYGYYSDDMFPGIIPNWMIDRDMPFYVGTFLMPTLIYALVVMVVRFTPESKNHVAWKNGLMAIAVPVVCYLFAQLILPLWRPVGGDFSFHSLLILIIVANLVFLFFLIRVVFILAEKKSEQWLKYQLFWKVPITLLFPLLGLALNNDDFDDNKFATNFFGDFSDFWFYALAIINGILICLPNLEIKKYRIALFIGRCITFAYSLYFFFVFLPYLPVSIIAIIVFGAGFLMIAPLVLFVIHANELSKDFTYLRNTFSKRSIWVLSILSASVIPLCITGSFLNDKKILTETLDYVYNPDYSNSHRIDKVSLQETLDVLKSNKKNSRSDFSFGKQKPFLSAYYRWLVLDNMTLSDKKINRIQQIFFAAPDLSNEFSEQANEEVTITDVSVKSTYNETEHYWSSWVNLEIKSDFAGLTNYHSTFDLPEACWISDYYLDIGKKREKGLLVEEKSARWVFTQIENENRDPGILYYEGGNKVTIRVFPFSKGEKRRTGIQFCHKEPVQFNLDGHNIELGKQGGVSAKIVENENLVYIPASQKEKLKKVQRKPYFHFLVDVSKNMARYQPKFKQRIEKLLAKHKNLAKNAKISFVNTYSSSVPLDKNWKEKYNSQHFEGGFFLERAMNKMYFDAYNNPDNSYPIPVVVTLRLGDAILGDDFSDFKMAFPENNLFFNVRNDGELIAHSLLSDPLYELPDTIPLLFGKNVLQYKCKDHSIAYVEDNNQASIVLKKDLVQTPETEIKERSWNAGLTLQGMWKSQILHPENADAAWLNTVKYSFSSKIMSPLSSYIVVENEAQKAMLKKKQQLVLAGNKSFDLDESVQSMSEPGLLFTAILLGFVLWYRKRRMRLNKV